MPFKFRCGLRVSWLASVLVMHENADLIASCICSNCLHACIRSSGDNSFKRHKKYSIKLIYLTSILLFIYFTNQYTIFSYLSCFACCMNKRGRINDNTRYISKKYNIKRNMKNTSMPLALFTLQYTSVKVIIPPPSCKYYNNFSDPFFFVKLTRFYSLLFKYVFQKNY